MDFIVAACSKRDFSRHFLTLLLIRDVSEVSDRFEYFPNRFVQPRVPSLKRCVSDTTLWALSNGIFIYHVRLKTGKTN